MGPCCLVSECGYTPSDCDPEFLALHVPGVAWVHGTKGPDGFPIACVPAAYRSGGVGLP
jgi:hypothetical protein